MADISKLEISSTPGEGFPAQNNTRPSAFPMAISQKMAARDITQGFTAAASGLTTGQLVKDEYFTLYEAVGALEIMDPKMDSGHLIGDDTLEDDFDVLRDLLPEEVLGIMDQMLCFEMAWHMGHPLSQSLFTSVYLERLMWPEPKTLDQARFDENAIPEKNQILHSVLRAYCLGLVKACDFVHQRITTEHFYEEEDFVSNLYHRRLFSDFDSTDIEQELNHAITYLEDEETDINKSIKDALINRLVFRKHFLRAVRTDDIIDQPRVSLWEKCIEAVSGLKATAQLGKPVEESFSIKIQRKLASTVPPRPIVKLEFDDAHKYLISLCQYSKEAYRILDYRGGAHLLTFVWSFQSRTPQPSAYVRSLLQSLIVTETTALGFMSFKQLLFDDLEEIVLPADSLVDPKNSDVEAPQDPRFQMKKKMDDFVTRAANPYLDIFRTVCMNRSRLRRMLCHLVLEWDSVQFDAETYDTELRTYTREQPIKESDHPNDEIWAFPLSSWAYYHKLRQMEWIVHLGFELDIYQVDELGGMYWYLQHIASTRIQHLERIRTFITRSLKCIPKPTAEQITKYRRSISFLDFATLEASAIQSFADGLSCLYSFLSHIGLIPPPYHAMPYSSPSMRYNLRMRPFLSISLPEMPSFPEFLSLVSLRIPGKTDQYPGTLDISSQTDIRQQAFSILEVTDQALKIARKEWETLSKARSETARCVSCEDWWRSSVKNILRSCITANIMVAAAKKAVTNAGPKITQDALKVDIPDSGKGYHTWWIVPRITAT